MAIAAAVGAPLRYLLDRAVQRRVDAPLPTGTLAVNLTGAFALGLVVGLAADGVLPHAWLTIVGTGGLGAYSTFSTFSWETWRLVEDGALADAGLNVAASLVGGLLAGAAGLGLALLG